MSKIKISLKRNDLVSEERFIDYMYTYVKRFVNKVDEKDYKELCLNIDKHLKTDYKNLIVYGISFLYEVDLDGSGVRSIGNYIDDTNIANKFIYEAFKDCKIYTLNKSFTTKDGVIYYISDIVFRFVNSLPDRFPENVVKDKYVFEVEIKDSIKW